MRDDQRGSMDIMHAFGNRQRRIQRNHVIQVGRETFFKLRHQLDDFLFVIQCIRSR